MYLYDSFKSCSDVLKHLENLQIAIRYLPVCNINNIDEDLLSHIMPLIVQTLNQVSIKY